MLIIIMMDDDVTWVLAFKQLFFIHITFAVPEAMPVFIFSL